MGPPKLAFSLRRSLESAGVAKGARMDPRRRCSRCVGVWRALALEGRNGTPDADVLIALAFGGRWRWKGQKWHPLR
jgi:hypothetical protein